MKLFVAFCLVAVVAADFKAFQEMQGKNYQNLDEASKAKAHYERNMRFIEEHNEKFAAGRVSFSIGENQFTDQNYTEVIARLCKTLPPKDMRNLPAAPQEEWWNLPPGDPSKDWTSIMQPIADYSYSECSSSWAFAAVAQLESLYRRSARKTYYSLSQQYLVDCSEKNNGCNGGWPSYAMRFILSTGIPLAKDYPYTAKTGTCKNPPPAFVPKLPTEVVIYYPIQNKMAPDEAYHRPSRILKSHVSLYGPVVVGVWVTELFVKYKSGIFYDESCLGTGLVNLYVVVVGYGTDSKGIDYWIIRNAWGKTWGENGYIRMRRNTEHDCSVTAFVTYMK